MKRSPMRAYSGKASLSGWRLGLTENVRHLFGPSGGLSYHLSALRYRRLWLGFLTKVQSWLEQWSPPEKNLMIFGASAGWSIPATFLERFNSIVIVEPTQWRERFCDDVSQKYKAGG